MRTVDLTEELNKEIERVAREQDISVEEVYKRAIEQLRSVNSPGESEFEERGRLIEKMLDKINPIRADASDEERQSIDAERQILAMRAGWTSMPLRELRRISNK